MSISRREFVRVGTTAATTAAAWGAFPGSTLFGAARTGMPLVHGTDDTGVLDTLSARVSIDDARSLAERAVDAARSAGAQYADVRLTRVVRQTFERSRNITVAAVVADEEQLAVGVRARVDGYWGFASSPYWDAEEVTRLATDAVAQARTNAGSEKRPSAWAAAPRASGEWVSPGIDPWSITIEEKIDFLNAWRQAINDTYVSDLVLQPSTAKLGFARQEQFLATTEGTFVSQVLYDTSGAFPFSIAPNDWRAIRDGEGTSVSASGLHAQRGGWDVILDAKVRDQIPSLIEFGREILKTPRKAVDIGRYDIVFDASAVGGILAGTLARATQLDYAMGLEANAGGTSFLGPDPLSLLGTMRVAAPEVTISANRSEAKGCATVRWDDEGVVPDTFPLVQDGILVDYQTTREQAPWLAPWYTKRQQPVRSHGCANSESALANTMQFPPNITLEPAKSDATFESLISGMTGLAIVGGWTNADFQGKSGMGSGLVREVTNGKLGKICVGAGFMFGSIELWKNVAALGGGNSVAQRPSGVAKGQPTQQSLFSVSSVPMLVKSITVIDMARRS